MLSGQYPVSKSENMSLTTLNKILNYLCTKNFISFYYSLQIITLNFNNVRKKKLQS